VARYKHLSVKKGSLSELKSSRPERKLTARQLAQQERDEEIKSVINEAAALPASEWAGFELKGDQKLPTMRAAINRILKAEPRNINFGVRGNTMIFSKGSIPGGRGRRKQ
jgi:hypothetical protein